MDVSCGANAVFVSDSGKSTHVRSNYWTLDMWELLASVKLTDAGNPK